MLVRKNVPLVTLSWREGRYFDLWMLVHAMMGVVIGLAAVYFDISFAVAVWAAFIGMVVYEVLEDVFNIHEVIENRVLDVIFGIIGVMVSYYVASAYLSQSTHVLIAGVGAVILLVVLSGMGWLAWIRRTGRTPFLKS